MQGQGEFADLVDKQGSSIGNFEEPAFASGGSREGSLFVAEQFAFHQRFGQRATIDGDKRLAGPLASLLNGTRHEFFSRSAFSFD